MWIAKNSTSRRVEIRFDDILYSIAPNQMSHMSLQGEGGRVDFRLPPSRRLALVNTILQDGSKSEVFRVDMEKLGTKDLLCGEQHLWYTPA